ncbi:ARV1-like protein [Patellaria atrata CBS 101060]|uniref:Protein ARV n=1 Tax=Patellaria atrata CBS 101060 TaxID=1346257 RepID=A0A9P4S4F9_9PEZI|nr:ARV1-like protein [Patellaria atrata CBS 101060]
MGSKICIECKLPVPHLYTSYSKADDKSLGRGVKLTQCPRCKRFADKYVEHDFVVLFIDLVLIKPQVYRHLLFNRLGREDERFDPSILRLGILLLLFDVYLTWARIEKAAPTSNGSPHPNSLISTQPLLLQYLFFLALCTLETLSFHLPIRLLCQHPIPIPLPGILSRFTSSPNPMNSTSNPASTPSNSASTSSVPTLTVTPYYPHQTPLSTALLVSSCTKLFPILLIIWEYDLPSSASAVSWSVIVNNIAALEILMDCGYLRAAGLVVVGALCRGIVSWVVLRGVGLG